MTTDDLLALRRVRQLLESGATKSIRLASGLTLSDVAANLDVSPAAVSRWEARLRSPRSGTALRYGRLLEDLLDRPAVRR